MDLNPYINQLQNDITTAAAAGDEQTRNTAALLSSAIEPAVRLAMMNALADLAAEVTTQLDGQVVDVRLDGRDVRVMVSGTPTAASTDDEEPEVEEPQQSGFFPPMDGGDISRITLRLFDQLKSQAEQAASTQGVSLNTWLGQAVQNALYERRGRGFRGSHGHGHGRGRGPHGGRGRGRGPWDGPFEDRRGGPRRGDDDHGNGMRGWVQN